MFSRSKKYIVICLASLLLFFPVKRSEAFVPALAVWLLVNIGGDTILITDLVAGMTGFLSGAAWYDCNKFSLAPVCTNKSGSTPAGSAPAASFTVSLNPNAKRSNPDPTKFNDPVGSARDVTPKSTVSPSTPVDSSTMSSGAPYFSAIYSIYNPNTGGYDSNVVAGPSALDVTRAAVTLAGYTVSADLGCTSLNPGDYMYSPGGATCSFSTVGYGNTGNTAVYHASGSPADCAAGQSYTAANGCIGSGQPVVCPPGYISSNGSCSLQNAQAVQKPSSTPCEVLFDPNSANFLSDPANPNCSADGTVAGGTFTSPSASDGSTLSVSTNGAAGFDVTKTNADGSSTTLITGPFNQSQGGYPIAGTATTPANTNQNGSANCGLAGQLPCGVSLPSDNATVSAASAALVSGDGTGQFSGIFASIDPDKFSWSFIPKIPTAQCVDPKIQNPITDGTVDLPLCDAFNYFQFFVNCVLAVFCVYGCVRQVREALEA